MAFDANLSDNSLNLINQSALYIDQSSKLLYSINKLFFSILIIILFLYFIKWMFKTEESIIILPFHTFPKDKYDGKIVAQMLTSKLISISNMPDMKSECIKTNELQIQLINYVQESDLINSLIRKVDGPEGKWERGISTSSSISFSGITIPINSILVMIKNLIGQPGNYLTGNLQEIDDTIQITAYMIHPSLKSWVVKEQKGDKIHLLLKSWVVKEQKEDKGLFEIIDNMAYSIAFDLKEKTTNNENKLNFVKSWEEFKYFLDSIFMFNKYISTGNTVFLENALHLTEKAITFNSKNPKLWNNLGIFRMSLYELESGQFNLEETIKSYRNAIRFRINDDMSYYISLNNLACALNEYYQYEGIDFGLQDAAKYYELALSKVDKQSTYYPLILSNYGNNLLRLADSKSEQNFLEESIKVYKQAIAASNIEFDIKINIHLNLGAALISRYSAFTENNKDLEEGLDYIKKACESIPEDSSLYEMSVNILSAGLFKHYMRRVKTKEVFSNDYKDITEIENRILFLNETLHHVSSKSPQYIRLLVSLANFKYLLSYAKYETNGEMVKQNSEEAIKLYANILDMAPEKWPHRTKIYVFLAFAYIILYRATHENLELDNSLKYFDLALKFDQNYAQAWYIKSCVHVLKKEKEEALIALKKAIKLDKKWLYIVKKDEEWKCYQSDSEYIELIKEMEKYWLINNNVIDQRIPFEVYSPFG